MLPSLPSESQFSISLLVIHFPLGWGGAQSIGCFVLGTTPAATLLCHPVLVSLFHHFLLGTALNSSMTSLIDQVVPACGLAVPMQLSDNRRSGLSFTFLQLATMRTGQREHAPNNIQCVPHSPGSTDAVGSPSNAWFKRKHWFCRGAWRRQARQFSGHQGAHWES